jgi:DNA gyrase/topoisomerase IV subunit B
MRAVLVGIEHTHEVPELLNFYMGTNTAERRRYIMENLV